MATPNPSLSGQGTGPTVLSVDDVTKIIATAKNSADDPVSVAMQVFSGLGDNVTASGGTLRDALSASGVSITGPLQAVLAAIEGVTKNGDAITVTNSQEVQIQLSGTPIKFQSQVSFEVDEQDGLPALQNIVGAAVHKFLWFTLQSIQIIDDQGQKAVRVVTSGGSKDIPLS